MIADRQPRMSISNKLFPGLDIRASSAYGSDDPVAPATRQRDVNWESTTSRVKGPHPRLLGPFGHTGRGSMSRGVRRRKMSCILPRLERFYLAISDE